MIRGARVSFRVGRQSMSSRARHFPEARFGSTIVHGPSQNFGATHPNVTDAGGYSLAI